MKVMLVTDAWHPQVNGVVRTLAQIQHGLTERGHEVLLVAPEGLTFPCPTYSEIRLSLKPRKQILAALQAWSPDAIHIATEGPLGWAARQIALERGWPFTTSFHTRFPEYLKGSLKIPRRWTYGVLRGFHEPAQCTLVPTSSLQKQLFARGITKTRVWSRGVDTEVFHPRFRRIVDLPKPILLYVGRVSTEKNIEAFLKLATPGTKVVVGEGPQKARLEKQFHKAVFTGACFGEALASWYASADVFVFPSRTDTFGLVLLEALASGTPVAAYPVTGPLDIIRPGISGTLSEDLLAAVLTSLKLNRSKAREAALEHSWSRCTAILEDALVPIHGEPDRSVFNRETSSECPL